MKIGVPDFGSTKSIEVHVSSAGKSYTEVAADSLGQATAEQKIMKFQRTKARYMKIISAGYHPKKVGYNQNHVF